jgi:GntR family transcriptional regulator
VNIIISNQSDLPIYEQIAESFKEKILSGEISGGELLPSIRSLAKDLRISVITTKRAYEELEKEGFIETIPGKGCFVKTKSSELLREEVLRKIEEHLINAVHMAISYGIGQEELDEILSYLYEEGGRHE